MKQKLVYSDYQQLFSTEGMSYLTSDIIMDYYKNLGAVATFARNKLTSFLPKSAVEHAMKEGLQMFQSEKLFAEFATAFENYYKSADLFFETFFSAPEISREQCVQAFDLFSENAVHYSKTEFFYVDEAHRHADSDPVIKKNFKEFEGIKNGGRLKMNRILFQPDSYRKTLVKRLSTQFTIPYNDLLMYSRKEIIDLYAGSRISDATLRAREVSYFMIGQPGGVNYFFGAESEKMVDDFFAQNQITSDNQDGGEILKGVVAHKGKARGRVTLIKYGDNAFARFPEIISKMQEGNVLVADTTAPELFMACKKASAILTNQGGMMSHAAIVSRELNIPCIVGLKNITQQVKEGDMVEVDADQGLVKILQKNTTL